MASAPTISAQTDCRLVTCLVLAVQLRHVFTDEQKLAVLMEIERPCATVSAFARRRGIVTRLLFRWRAQFGFAQENRVGLAPVTMDGASSAALLVHDLLSLADGMIVVELSDRRRVFAREGSDPDAVRAHVESGEIAQSPTLLLPEQSRVLAERRSFDRAQGR